MLDSILSLVQSLFFEKKFSTIYNVHKDQTTKGEPSRAPPLRVVEVHQISVRSLIFSDGVAGQRGGGGSARRLVHIRCRSCSILAHVAFAFMLCWGLSPAPGAHRPLFWLAVHGGLQQLAVDLEKAPQISSSGGQLQRRCGWSHMVVSVAVVVEEKLSACPSSTFAN